MVPCRGTKNCHLQLPDKHFNSTKMSHFTERTIIRLHLWKPVKEGDKGASLCLHSGDPTVASSLLQGTSDSADSAVRLVLWQLLCRQWPWWFCVLADRSVLGGCDVVDSCDLVFSVPTGWSRIADLSLPTQEMTSHVGKSDNVQTDPTNL